MRKESYRYSTIGILSNFITGRGNTDYREILLDKETLCELRDIFMKCDGFFTTDGVTISGLSLKEHFKEDVKAKFPALYEYVYVDRTKYLVNFMLEWNTIVHELLETFDKTYNTALAFFMQEPVDKFETEIAGEYDLAVELKTAISKQEADISSLFRFLRRLSRKYKAIFEDFSSISNDIPADIPDNDDAYDELVKIVDVLNEHYELADDFVLKLDMKANLINVLHVIQQHLANENGGYLYYFEGKETCTIVVRMTKPIVSLV